MKECRKCRGSGIVYGVRCFYCNDGLVPERSEGEEATPRIDPDHHEPESRSPESASSIKSTE